MKIIWYFIFLSHPVYNLYGSDTDCITSRWQSISNQAYNMLLLLPFFSQNTLPNHNSSINSINENDKALDFIAKYPSLARDILSSPMFSKDASLDYNFNLNSKNEKDVTRNILNHHSNDDDDDDTINPCQNHPASSLKIDQDSILSDNFMDSANIIFNAKFVLWAAKKNYIGILRSVFNYRERKISNIDFGNDENNQNIKEQIKNEILRKEIPIDWPNRDGQTLLMLAASYKRLDIIDLLLENGADTSKQDNNNLTALDYALSYSYDSCVCDVSVYMDIFKKLKKEKIVCTPLQMKKLKRFCSKYTTPENDSNLQQLKDFFEENKSFFTDEQYTELQTVIVR